MPRHKPRNHGARNSGSHGLRTPVLDDEIFAVVAKMLGGPNVRVVCADGLERLCIIRKSFRGRGKRGNQVANGGLLLVGRRSWAGSREGKLPVCDLLCVYSNEEARTLQSRGLLPHSMLAGGEGSGAPSTLDDGLEFADDAPLADLPPGLSGSESADEWCHADGTPAATTVTLLEPGDLVDADEI